MENATFSQLSQFGFTPVNNAVCVGTWNNYAVELQRYAGRTYYVYLAIRIGKTAKALKKALTAAFKGAGLKNAAVYRVNPNYLHCTFSFGKGENEIPSFRTFMDTLTAALAQNGVGPAETCAVTGAPNPDSLCLMLNNKFVGYQPVCSGAVRQKDSELQASVEENENNGSYASGFLGALIGMLLAVAVNVAVMLATDRMYALLFALVPLAAMFGYKLFKGKTNKASLIIVILLSLLAIPAIVYFIGVVTLMREYALSAGDALRAAGEIITDPEYLKEIRGELLMMLLFMALGLFFAWRFISSQLNSTKTATSRIQLDTMRPNPACAGSVAAAAAEPAAEDPAESLADAGYAVNPDPYPTDSE